MSDHFTSCIVILNDILYTFYVFEWS